MQSSSEAKRDFPRQLRPKERDLLHLVLPSESPGYNEYRIMIDAMVVLAEGRRGAGNFVLGKLGDQADITSPLAPVIAFGMLETTRDTFTITVRECIENQIDAEIVSSRGEEIPDHFEEKRRWTYSSWKPGMQSPATGEQVRELSISPEIVLAIAPQEQRIWLHDGGRRMNHLIPITNFYNELMLHKRIRDPKIALKSSLLFSQLDNYSDADLREAFLAYNKRKKKVEVQIPTSLLKEEGLLSRLKKMLQ